MSHIWGSMAYWQSQRFANQTSPRWPMIYDGPTTASLFNTDNAVTIEDNGFGHVRFFFDPLLCGSTNFLGQYVYPSATNITPGMAALIQDIHTANAEDLAVVLNFFPYWISYEHNYRTVNGDLITGKPWSNNAESWKRSWTGSTENPFGNPNLYPGPWRKDFAMHYGNISGIDQNHPLPKLWKGITEILHNEGFTPGEVYLQPISEAQTGFSDANNFGESPEEVINDYVLGEFAFKKRYEAWRKIQLETIQAIWSVNPEYKVLVTSQESFPWSYRNEHTAQGVPGFTGFSSFVPYTRDELGEPTENLIYTFHMYSPYDFTHNASVTGDREQYINKGADALQLIVYQFNRDDFAPNPPTTVSPHVRVNEYHYNGALEHFNLMKRWLNSSFKETIEADESTWAPPLMITEFGAWRKLAAEFTPPPGTQTPLGDTVYTVQEGTPTDEELYPLDYQRARWVYDIRKLAQDNNYGWTYFDFAGGFRAFKRSMFKFNHTNLLREDPQPTTFVPRFSAALFGVSRP